MKRSSGAQEIYAPKDVQIPMRLGGGVLKERVIRHATTKQMISYALAYINSHIFSGDNDRVLGYDNSHGYTHRHFMGTIEQHTLTTYEALYGLFETEWRSIALDFLKGK